LAAAQTASRSNDLPGFQDEEKGSPLAEPHNPVCYRGICGDRLSAFAVLPLAMAARLVARDKP
jgi:hypothetical protein